MANKQDKAEALDKNAILEDLKIERLANESETLCRVVRILKNGYCEKILIFVVFRNYVQLNLLVVMEKILKWMKLFGMVLIGLLK